MFARSRISCSTAPNPTSAPSGSFSANVFRRAGRKDTDPFFRDGTGFQKAMHNFRKRPAFIRYPVVFGFGFLVGAVIEVFACKTKLYEAVMVKKDARRHELDEFVVDFRRNVERWQTEDMKRAAAAASSTPGK